MIEYKIIQECKLFKNNIKAMETRINELAKEGWRVISVSITEYRAFATMERDKI